ncbi:MAG: class I SAM-dependent methyltransferase [Rhizobiaceae bacterium]
MRNRLDGDRPSPFANRILANDISPRMIEIAEQKASAEGISNVTFQTIAFDDFTAPDESFDAVLGMSILHLVGDRDEAIRKVYALLKPGGVFISSTACLGDKMKFFKLIGPIGRALGLIPLVRVFSTAELVDSLTKAGFEIDHQWRPGKSPAVFIVAKK